MRISTTDWPTGGGRWLCGLLLLGATAMAELPRVGELPSRVVAVGDDVQLTGWSDGATSLQWRRNGVDIPGATSLTLVLSRFQMSDAGTYTLVASNAEGSVESPAAVLAPVITTKAAGAAREVGQNIVHPNGNIYDQVLLTGPVASVTADWGQTTRVSFVDLNDDIVQVEFSGRGTLTVLLDEPSGPALAAKYEQPGVSYMKGHATLLVAGSDETTNVSAFAVGRVTAVNQALFRPGESYDGVADLGLLAIVSDLPQFGGVWMADAAFFQAMGMTGIYAPTAMMVGPVYVSDIRAEASATPVLRFRKDSAVWITGGDLFQPNGRAVDIGLVAEVWAQAGMTAAGGSLPAQAIRGRLAYAGEDVTGALLDRTPEVVTRVPPVYPLSLRMAGITGDVLIEFIVDTTGRVQNAFAVRATRQEFADASITAINQWVFLPGRKAGRAVNTRMQQPITFSLSPDGVSLPPAVLK